MIVINSKESDGKVIRAYYQVVSNKYFGKKYFYDPSNETERAEAEIKALKQMKSIRNSRFRKYMF